MKKLFSLLAIVCAICLTTPALAGWGDVQGGAHQNNGAFVNKGFWGNTAGAEGQQGNVAQYSGKFIGGASVEGSTVVKADINIGWFSNNSSAFGKVENSGIAGTLGTTSVQGGGGVDAYTNSAKYGFTGGADAGTQSGAGFNYNNSGILLTTGSGIATTCGYSQTNIIPNGYSAYSTATSFSKAQ